MKKLFTAFVIAASLFAGNNLFAQGKWGPDSAECVLHLSYYREYFKQKSYDDAMRNWRVAYQLCPASSSEKLIVDGTTLVKDLIKKNYRNTIYKEALIDTLMDLYNVRVANFPKNKVTALNNKGVDVHNLIKDDNARIHKEYKEIIDALGAEAKPTFFLYDLQALSDLYQAGAVEPEELIDTYQQFDEYLSQMEPKNDADAEQLASVKSNLGTIFGNSNVASCDKLLEIFGPKFDADPENVQLATSIVKNMNYAEDCDGNDLYLRAVTVMHNSNPSALSAFALYKLNANAGDVNAAISYIEDAIRMEEDAAKKADYNYQLAVYAFKSGHNAKAYDAALQCVKNDESMAGKAYFLIGTIWGSVRCGGNEITGRANYWVAVDYFAKAKAADPSLTEEANRYIGRFSAYFPSTADAFMYNIQKGQGFTASCGGMTASTTVKTQ